MGGTQIKLPLPWSSPSTAASFASRAVPFASQNHRFAKTLLIFGPMEQHDRKRCQSYMSRYRRCRLWAKGFGVLEPP